MSQKNIILILILYFLLIADIDKVIVHSSQGEPILYLNSTFKVTSPAMPGIAQSKTVAGAGDVNNDGFSDYLIGIPNYQTNGFTGAVFLIYGSSSLQLTIDVSTLNGTNAVQFNGEMDGDRTGSAISTAGNVNNDDFDDFLIGARHALFQDGVVYLIYGASSIPHPFNLSSLNGVNGVRFQGFGELQLGTSFCAIGDMNQDGFSDFLMGAPKADNGTIFLIYGNSSLPHPFNLSYTNPNGTNGITFLGSNTFDKIGSAISLAGDVNNDGIQDILFAGEDATGDALYLGGVVYLIFGSTSLPHPFQVSSINGTNGAYFPGYMNGQSVGSSISHVGDMNTDGYDDFLIGTTYQDFIGSVYIIYGRPSFPHPFDLSTINGTNGAIIYGSSPSDSAGNSLTAAGDLNLDGYPDFFIGALGTGYGNNPQSGSVYLVFGQPLFPSAFNLSSLEQAPIGTPHGMLLSGYIPSASVGTYLSTVGDVNNDGFTDFMASTSDLGDNPNNVSTVAYLLLGTSTYGHNRNLDTLALEPCPPGFAAVLALTNDSCYQCPLGSYSPGIPLSSCLFCPPGSYADLPEKSECTKCPGGTFSTKTGQISSQTCSSCSSNTYSLFEGSSTCTKCPELATCKRGSQYPQPLPGYQLTIDGSSVHIVQCTPKEACPGVYPPKCSQGYANPNNLCSECDIHYYRNNGRCDLCASGSSALLPLFSVIYVTVLLIIIPLSAGGHRFGVSSMYTGLFQIISLFGFIQIPKAPQLWSFTFNVIQSSLISFEIASPQCTSDLSQNQSISQLLTSWYLQMFSPIITLAIYLLFYPLGLGFQRILKPFARKYPDRYFWRFILTARPKHFRMYIRSAVVYAMTILYTIVTKSSISMLSCTEKQENAKSVVRLYPFLDCASPEWIFPAVLSSISLLIFTIGFPCFIYFYVHKQAKHAYQSGIQQSDTKKLVYGIFLDKYKPQYTYWEAVSLARRAALLVSTLLISTNILVISFFFCLIFIASTILQNQHNPYWTIWLNRFELLIITVSFIILLLANSLANFLNDPTTQSLNNSQAPIIISWITVLVLVGTFFISLYFAIQHRFLFNQYKKAIESSKNKVEDLDDI